VPENWNDKKAFQLESLLMAASFWQDVEKAGGQSAGYLRSGRLQPVADQSALDLARARAETARTLWADAARWSVVAAPTDPWSPPSPTGMLIHDTLSARLHPRRACMALAAALASKGIPVVTEAPDRGRVIWATGVDGLLEFNRAHHRMVGNGVKGQAALLDFDMRAAPQLFVDGLHIVPHAGGTVAIGSTSERDFSEVSSTDAQLDLLLHKARSALPVLANAPVIARWAGVRPRTRSRAPMLGPWPGRPGHYIANGGFKIGFGMAPKVADVMADLLLEDKDHIPEGFKVEASF
jgi:glycine oxidase